jgi:hypothetical protein
MPDGRERLLGDDARLDGAWRFQHRDTHTESLAYGRHVRLCIAAAFCDCAGDSCIADALAQPRQYLAILFATDPDQMFHGRLLKVLYVYTVFVKTGFGKGDFEQLHMPFNDHVYPLLTLTPPVVTFVVIPTDGSPGPHACQTVSTSSPPLFGHAFPN